MEETEVTEIGKLPMVCHNRYLIDNWVAIGKDSYTVGNDNIDNGQLSDRKTCSSVTIGPWHSRIKDDNLYRCRSSISFFRGPRSNLSAQSHIITSKHEWVIY